MTSELTVIRKTVFWALILIRLVAGFATGGVDRARGNLHRLILVGSVSGQIDKDPIAAISRGYEGLTLCLVITWALREIYVFARKKV